MTGTPPTDHSQAPSQNAILLEGTHTSEQESAPTDDDKEMGNTATKHNRDSTNLDHDPNNNTESATTEQTTTKETNVTQSDDDSEEEDEESI